MTDTQTKNDKKSLWAEALEIGKDAAAYASNLKGVADFAANTTLSGLLKTAFKQAGSFSSEDIRRGMDYLTKQTQAQKEKLDEIDAQLATLQNKNDVQSLNKIDKLQRERKERAHTISSMEEGLKLHQQKLKEKEEIEQRRKEENMASHDNGASQPAAIVQNNLTNSGNRVLTSSKRVSNQLALEIMDQPAVASLSAQQNETYQNISQALLRTFAELNFPGDEDIAAVVKERPDILPDKRLHPKGDTGNDEVFKSIALRIKEELSATPPHQQNDPAALVKKAVNDNLHKIKFSTAPQSQEDIWAKNSVATREDVLQQNRLGKHGLFRK